LGAGTVDTKVVAGITTDGTSTLILGVNATTLGKVKMFGNTSGDVTIQPSAVAGTATVLTLPATTDTLVGKATTDTLTNKTLTTPVINGTITGTGQATAATASTITMRDSNANIFVNNSVFNITSTATAAGTTTLTVASTRYQRFTGTTIQFVDLPVTSTLTLGHTFTVINESTNTVIVRSSAGSGNEIRTLGANSTADFICISTSGTGPSSWFSDKILTVLENNSSSTNTGLVLIGNQGGSKGKLGITGTNGNDFIISAVSYNLILNTGSTNRLTILSTLSNCFSRRY